MPTFQEQFLFDITDLDLGDLQLEFNLMDYDRFIKDVRIGQVVVGIKAPGATGRSHWEEVVISPRKEISRWHEIVRSSDALTL